MIGHPRHNSYSTILGNIVQAFVSTDSSLPLGGVMVRLEDTSPFSGLVPPMTSRVIST